MRTKKNILYHTFVGLNAEIVGSASPELVGFRGKIIDETKNMLVFWTEDGVRKIQKKPNVFRFYLEDGTTVDLIGEGILFRPHERPKKAKKRTAILN